MIKTSISFPLNTYVELINFKDKTETRILEFELYLPSNDTKNTLWNIYEICWYTLNEQKLHKADGSLRSDEF